jgi:hypothetical protein
MSAGGAPENAINASHEKGFAAQSLIVDVAVDIAVFIARAATQLVTHKDVSQVGASKGPFQFVTRERRLVSGDRD